jgi:hypothetical protein
LYWLSWKALNIPGAYFPWGQNLDSRHTWLLYHHPQYFVQANLLPWVIYCPMRSNYVIQQRLYTDVKCNEPGPFYCCGCTCSDIVFKLSNRTESAHGSKMYCPGHFTALGGETLVYSNYLTEHTCTWM